MNGDVAYSPPDYICRVCDYIVGTDTDIESDNDSDYQPGERDGTDGEGEDDEATDDTAPVNPLDVDVSILLFAASTSSPQTCEKLTSPAAIVVDPVAGSFLLKLPSCALKK